MYSLLIAARRVGALASTTSRRGMPLVARAMSTQVKKSDSGRFHQDVNLDENPAMKEFFSYEKEVAESIKDQKHSPEAAPTKKASIQQDVNLDENPSMEGFLSSVEFGYEEETPESILRKEASPKKNKSGRFHQDVNLDENPAMKEFFSYEKEIAESIKDQKHAEEVPSKGIKDQKYAREAPDEERFHQDFKGDENPAMRDFFSSMEEAIAKSIHKVKDRKHSEILQKIFINAKTSYGYAVDAPDGISDGTVAEELEQIHKMLDTVVERKDELNLRLDRLADRMRLAYAVDSPEGEADVDLEEELEEVQRIIDDASEVMKPSDKEKMEEALKRKRAGDPEHW